MSLALLDTGKYELYSQWDTTPYSLEGLKLRLMIPTAGEDVKCLKPLTLFIGVEDDTVTLENGLTVSQTVKYTHTIWYISSNPR